MPVAGVAALDDDNRILLVRRADSGEWAHPAGRVEAGETWAETARREFREETGGEVDLAEVLGVYSDPATQMYRYPTGELVQFVGVAYRGTVRALGTHHNDEVSEVGWFSPASLPIPIFGPARPIIEDALSSP